MIPLHKTCGSTYKMSAKLCFNLLILYGVLCQGTLGTHSEKDNDKSFELLVRQKRVINHTPGGDVRQLIKYFPYIVSIRPYRILRHCSGTVLNNNIILTIAECVAIDTPRDYYRVYSGTAKINGKQFIHSITDKRILVGIHPYRPNDGIALIKINPPVVYSRHLLNIPLYNGFLHPGAIVTVSGWGCNPEGDLGTQNPEHLRSINVPIISNQDCGRLYGSHFVISEFDICTLDTTHQQYCGANDGGAPLVVIVNAEVYLAGILLHNGKVGSHHNPDIFINLQAHRYKSWIMNNIPILEQTV